MTDPHEERAYFEWTLYLAQMSRGATVRDAFRAAWRARGEYERAQKDLGLQHLRQSFEAAREALRDYYPDRDNPAALIERIERAWMACEVALASGPTATTSPETRHESWCAGSGGECRCDAPEFGPHD